jgi:DeoR family fructose operon transcriptional repressor
MIQNESIAITTAERDLAPERMDKITQILRQERVVRVRQLCQRIGVSPATIRRDLNEMETRGLVRKVHGGAVAVDARLDEPVFDDKTGLQAAEKQRIAAQALEYVRPRDTIFLDGGSTILALAGQLQSMKQLTVVTNSLRVASLLSGSGPRLIVVGGELRSLSQTFVGPLTAHTLRHLHVDTAFMGTIGLTAREGLTTTDPREAFTKELVIANARRVVLLADGSKLGAVSFVSFAPASAVDILLTDAGAPRPVLRDLRKIGVKVTEA